jgi:hypothetical protein
VLCSEMSRTSSLVERLSFPWLVVVVIAGP